jgi:hypothetical protein
LRAPPAGASVPAVDPDAFDPGGRFRAEVAASLASDPMPTLRMLAANLGLPLEDVVHYALHRWAAAGSEALLSGPPEALEALRDAAEAGDVERVRGIVAWLMAAWGDPAEPA